MWKPQLSIQSRENITIYNTPTFELGLKLSIQFFRISRPEPINLDNKTYQAFNVKPHPLDSSNGALFEINALTDAYVHPVSKIIVRTQGGTLSQEDDDYLNSIWDDDFIQYQNEQGQFPYQSVENWKQTIINYWSQFTQMYPDSNQQEEVKLKLINQERVSIDDILPNWVRQLTELEKLVEKWEVKDFNQLEQWELESDRFTGISTSLAQSIITERSNGNFINPSDVANRVSGIGSVIQTDLENQVTEGSLTFESF